MTLEQIIIFAHIIGTIIGVGGATMIEAHLAQSFKDKIVSSDERAILAIDYRTVRIGLIIILLSGFGFLLLDKFENHTQYLYSPRLWAKMLMVIMIAVNALMLQTHTIPLYWGSAFSFASWWTAAFVGMFITHSLKFDFFGMGGFWTTFSSLMLLYAVTVLIGGFLLHIYRNRVYSRI